LPAALTKNSRARARRIAQSACGATSRSACFSGGLDRHNAALFSEGESRPVRTFSIGYDCDDAYANEYYAQMMASRIGADHHGAGSRG
jgi:hypothetical protein